LLDKIMGPYGKPRGKLWSKIERRNIMYVIGCMCKETNTEGNKERP
jgi:hypothetical protein